MSNRDGNAGSSQHNMLFLFSFKFNKEFELLCGGNVAEYFSCEADYNLTICEKFFLETFNFIFKIWGNMQKIFFYLVESDNLWWVNQKAVCPHTE